MKPLFHRFFKRITISTIPLVVLVLSTNVAFAKNRVIRHPVNRPRIQLITRHKGVKRVLKKPRIRVRKRNRPIKRNRHKNVRKTRHNRSVKRIKHHMRERSAQSKRNRKRINRKRRRSRGRYDIFNSASLRHLKVLKNSTRINSRVPKMKLIMTFPNVYRGGRWPQSLNVDRKGHYAYIGFDSFANDGSKVLRYNFRRHHFTGIGRTFSGGHAQAVSADKNSNLWFVDRTSNDEADDHEGPINKGSFVEVSPWSLKPIYRRFFRFGHNYMGDNLAFAGKYGVFNVSRIMGRNHTNNKYREHMLVFYHTNKLNHNGNQWSQIGALRNTPGDFIIQAVSYNPRSQRLYVASSDPTDIMSMPVKKILKLSLRKKDIHVASYWLGYRREIEGLAFDHKGYMYLLLGSPGQLLRSRRPVTK